MLIMLALQDTKYFLLLSCFLPIFFSFCNKHFIMNVSNLDLRGCGFSLKTKQNNSSISDDYPQAEDKWSGGGEGEQCRTSKAGVGHLGQPSMCSGRPCYPVSNRWSSLHHSLPGCQLGGCKRQHPAGEVSGSESHWIVTGWSVQTLSYENDFLSSDSMSSASPPHMGKSKCMTLSSIHKILSFPDADQLLSSPQESSHNSVYLLAM